MWSETGSRSVPFRERGSDLAFSFLLNANPLIFFSLFTVHYTPDPLSNLFDSTMKENISMHLYFQVQALIISRKNILELPALIPGGDQLLFIQDNLFSCRLVPLGSMYMRNYVIIFANISPLLGLCTKIFEDHRKGGVTSKVSNPPFTNLIQRSDNFSAKN